MVKWPKFRSIYAMCAIRVAIIRMDLKIIITKNTRATFISARKRIVSVFLRRMQHLRFIKNAAIKEAPHVQCALSSPPQTTECDTLPTLALMLRSENAATHYEVVGYFLKQSLSDITCSHVNQRPLEHAIKKGSAFGLRILAVKVGVIGNLVHSSPNVKKEVLNAGVWQPVIGLLSLSSNVARTMLASILPIKTKHKDSIASFLHISIFFMFNCSSCCTESQREATLLLGKFAATDSDCKVCIIQRGAARSLIDILQSPDVQLREMAAFALGRLAQDTHCQAGIVYDDGLMTLLKLLESKHGPLQHNAAFTLYGLADNEAEHQQLIDDAGALPQLNSRAVNSVIQRAPDVITNLAHENNSSKTDLRIEGAVPLLVELLQYVVSKVQRAAAGALQTLVLKNDENKNLVLNHLRYLMRVGEKFVQRRVALALAHLCSPRDQKTVFIDNKGLELLMGLLVSSSTEQQKDTSLALCKLATKATLHSTMDAAPLSPTPQVYLGIQFVNNATLSDVTFVIEGKQFHAHRITLLASSDAFRAMFDGGYRERDAKDIDIPCIRWEVFELMMRYIYTGLVDITLDVAQDLLRAADQYLLDGLKCLCECAIAKDISLENIVSMYELSEAFHAMTSRNSCIMFILEHHDNLVKRVGYVHTIQRVLPAIECYFSTALTKLANNSQ